MLASVCYVLSGVFAAFILVFKTLFPTLSIVEVSAVSAAVGVSASAWTALLLKSSLFLGTPGIPTLLVWTATVIQTAVAANGVGAVRRSLSKRAVDTMRQQVAATAPLLALVAALLAWFTYILYTHSLNQWGHGFFVGGSTYGDMPFHLNIIHSFLHGANADASLFSGFSAVFFAGAKLVYPYIPDWHVAVLVAGGASLPAAFTMVGVVLLGAFLTLLACFNLRLTGSVPAAGLATLLTLLCGGVGGFVWLSTDASWAGLLQVDHILYVVNSGPASILWLSLPAHILLPQRTTQYAYPVALAALIMLLKAYRPPPPADAPAGRGRARSGLPGLSPKPLHRRDGDSTCVLDADWALMVPADRTKLYAAAGLATGLLPLLQVHSFVAVGLVAMCLCAAQVGPIAYHTLRGGYSKPLPPPAPSTAAAVASPVAAGTGGHDTAHSTHTEKGRRSRFPLGAAVKHWALYGVCAFALGLPQLMVYVGKVSGNGKFVRLEGVWKDQNEPGPIPLWWEALGLFVPLNIYALLRTAMSTAQRTMQCALFVVFCVANVVIFQPWEVDNTKVFYVWMFGASGAVAATLCKPFAASTGTKNRNWLLKAAAVAVGASLMLSGTLCVIGETLSFSMMYDTADVESAEWIKANTPPDAVIATTSAGTHMRPESALAGRQVVVGYPGWMDSHGMPWHKRNTDIMDMYAGKNVRQTALLYNLTHIVVDWDHLARDTVLLRPINSIAYRAASNGRHVVYQVVPRQQLENVIDCLPGEHATEEACLAAGCEWVPYALGAWCQLAAVRSTLDPAQAPPVEDCGWSGIKESECLEQGCSWYTGYLSGPWCHFPVTAPASDPALHGLGGMLQPAPSGSDCGWNTMTKRQCHMRGCEWTPQEGPWCVHP